MYQFTEIFKEINVSTAKKTYRWRGLAAGMLLGWLPAWGFTHWRNGGGWMFVLVWGLTIPISYGIGKCIKK